MAEIRGTDHRIAAANDATRVRAAASESGAALRAERRGEKSYLLIF
jgi:hypothetical protein